jgi:C4-dicarboxylate-specific signal transduction histidine kinase
MTIGKKLDVGIGILLALFLLLGAVFYFQTKQIENSLREIARAKDLTGDPVYNTQINDLLDEDIRLSTNTALERATGTARKTVDTAVVVTLALILAGFIIGSASYIIINRSITKRITRLRDITSIIGRGNLDAQIEIGSNDEIGELAVSFNDMAHKLKESYTHLEEKVQERTAKLTAANKQLAREVDKRKKATTQLQTAQEKLIETARRVGMAEVATDVLHNVGNVLNSVSVTTESIHKRIRNSKVPYLADVADLLDEHAGDLITFLTTEDRGKKLPAFLANLSKELIAEQDHLLESLKTLTEHVKHMAEVIQLQQSYSKTKGLTESVSVADLVEDAIRINADALAQHNVQIRRELVDLPPILLDRHKVLQILTNMISNAKYALSKSNRDNKILMICVKEPEGGRIRIEVRDNGMGIARENLTRIFEHGFTTSKNGHGFGLHSAALAASEMNGSISVQSDGCDKGAVFTIELPFKTQETTK